jgi:hypothetical protein
MRDSSLFVAFLNMVLYVYKEVSMTSNSNSLDPKYEERRIHIMSRTNLIRWCGLAAVCAGILRGIASFTPTSTSVSLQFFYLAIDVLLFLGIIGLYGYQRKETGWWGFSGFLLALVGAGLLIGHDVVNASVNLYLYPIAALLFTVGISVLAIVSWVLKTLPRWACALLITSTIVGIPGYFIKGLAVLFVLSGVIFAIGFIGAGLKVWLQPVG